MSLMLSDDAPVHILQQSRRGISTASHVQTAQPLSIGMSSCRLLRAQRSEHLHQRLQGVWPPKVGLSFAKSLVGEGHPQCSAIPVQVYYNSFCQRQWHPASLAHVIFFCPVTTWTKTLDVHSFVYDMPLSSRSPIYPFIHPLADSLTPCVLTRIHPFTPSCSHLDDHACITHSIAYDNHAHIFRMARQLQACRVHTPAPPQALLFVQQACPPQP